jgi:Peptidase C10 family/Secretion system C-terminal sorting domain/Spi protease inhibitor
MARYFKTLIIIMFISSLIVNGQAVSEKVLNKVANNFMTDYFPGGARKIQSVIPLKFDSISSLNLFELEPEGWILLSADKKVEPVIGFSFTGHFKMPEQNLNDPVFNWLDLYHKQIKSIVADSSLKERSAWSRSSDNAVSRSLAAAAVRVDPFMVVNWGQGKNWNQFCPADKDGPGGHVYVGCVGVSLAQAMSVFKIPEKGQGYNNYLDPKYGTQFVNFGNTFYKWDSMSVSIADKYNSLLLYHCAVSVNMNFGADGSGTQTSYAASALRNYFGYSQKVLYQRRNGTDVEWRDLLNKQLLARRPIIYSGDADDGAPGHAFNIDGVINNSYFHINWGWSGSNNGYFTLDALNPATYNFNKNQAAVLGIQPFYYPTDITISDTIVMQYLPKGTIVGKLNVIDEATDNTYTLKLTCDSVFNGTEWVRNYFLHGDSLMTGRIFMNTDNGSDTIIISLKDKFNHNLIKKISLWIKESATGISSLKEENYDYFVLYPNPATDRILYIQKTQIKISSIRIYSISGALIRIINDPDPENGISLTGIQKGIYILEAELENHNLIHRRFIRN